VLNLYVSRGGCVVGRKARTQQTSQLDIYIGVGSGLVYASPRVVPCVGVK
jgi:hypothetical protein